MPSTPPLTFRHASCDGRIWIARMRYAARRYLCLKLGYGDARGGEINPSAVISIGDNDRVGGK